MTRSLTEKRAQITEIFSSLQGEGPRMGERHLFIRFEACHMNCAYCDEAGKSAKTMSVADVLREVARLERCSGPHVCVSLTGGEPLLYADFLKPLYRALKNRKYRVLLETSGILWQQLSKVIDGCDVIAMDLKLSSVTGQKGFLAEHRKFLRLAKKKEIYIKVVISRDVNKREYIEHLHMVAEVAPRTPVFLQPLSVKKRAYPDLGLMRFLDELQRIGAKRLTDVRVGIQLHKLLNIR
ncbi:MAG: 7-carboxy-7-deazaguanine synthase QueE [Candidatus Omnitrophota bacterium]